MNFEPSLQKS